MTLAPAAAAKNINSAAWINKINKDFIYPRLCERNAKEKGKEPFSYKINFQKGINNNA